MFQTLTSEGHGRTLASTGVSLLIYGAFGAAVAISAMAVKPDAVQKQVEVIFRAQPTASAPPPPPPPARSSKSTRALTPTVPTRVPDLKPEPSRLKEEPPVKPDREDGGAAGGVEGGVAGGVEGGVVGGTLGGTLGGTGRAPINLPENATPPQAAPDNQQPSFPETARAAGQEGQVILKIVVNADGSVGKIDVMRGDEPFVSAAVSMVKTWHYTPALVDGVAISVFRVVKIPFRLRG